MSVHNVLEHATRPIALFPWLSSIPTLSSGHVFHGPNLSGTAQEWLGAMSCFAPFADMPWILRDDPERAILCPMLPAAWITFKTNIQV